MYTFTFNGSTYAIGPYTLAVVGCIYAVSLVVVLVFYKYRLNISRRAVFFLFRIDVWGAIAFLVFVAWVVNTNSALIAGVDRVVFVVIFTFVSVMHLVDWADEYKSELIAFLALPVLAVITLFGVVIRGVKGVLFFLAKPPSVREIKRTIKQQHKHPDAGAHVKKVLDREARRVLSRQRRWWRPTFMISAATRHNKILAKYLHSLAEVGDAAETPLENEERKKHD